MVKNIRVINKIIIILIVLIMSSTVFSNIVYARPSDGTPSGAYTDTGTGGRGSVKTIVNTNDYGQGNLGNNTRALGIVGTILSVIQIIGVIVAVISVSILGIKYMTGSVEQKAEYKKTMIPFIIGVALIVASTTIIKAIYTIVSSNV